MDKYPGEIEAFLAEARAASQPGPNDRARIHRSFGDKLARRGLNAPAPPLAEGATTPAAAVTAKGAALGGRVALALLAACGLVAGSLWLGTQSHRPETPNAGTPAASAAPATVVQAPGPSAPGPRAAAPEPSPAVTRPSEQTPPVATRASRRVARKSIPEPVAASKPGLAEEVALIAKARNELEEGDARAALADLAIHARRFERGALREERMGLRVLALCRLGRNTEARAARERFLRTAGSSVLTGQVRACVLPDERPSP